MDSTHLDTSISDDMDWIENGSCSFVEKQKQQVSPDFYRYYASLPSLYNPEGNKALYAWDMKIKMGMVIFAMQILVGTAEYNEKLSAILSTFIINEICEAMNDDFANPQEGKINHPAYDRRYYTGIYYFQNLERAREFYEVFRREGFSGIAKKLSAEYR